MSSYLSNRNNTLEEETFMKHFLISSLSEYIEDDGSLCFLYQPLFCALLQKLEKMKVFS